MPLATAVALAALASTQSAEAKSLAQADRTLAAAVAKNGF